MKKYIINDDYMHKAVIVAESKKEALNIRRNEMDEDTGGYEAVRSSELYNGDEKGFIEWKN